MPTDYQRLAAKTVERRIVLFEKEVTAALQKALVAIRSDMAKIYERYAEAGILTHAQMTTANRLATAERQIVADLNKALGSNLQTLRQLNPEMYDEACFQYAWAMDQETRIRLSWGRLNTAAIRANLANADYADALRRYSPTQRARIREAINNGLIRGQSFEAMMRDLKTALSMSRGDAIRIVRTEGMRAANAGTIETFARAQGEGVEGNVVWVSVIDGKTRDQHFTMDGRTRSKDGLFHLPNGDVGAAPLDSSLSAKNVVHCRCTTRFEIKGYEPVLRRTRAAGLIPHQSFGEWNPAR